MYITIHNAVQVFIAVSNNNLKSFYYVMHRSEQFHVNSWCKYFPLFIYEETKAQKHVAF